MRSTYPKDLKIQSGSENTLMILTWHAMSLSVQISSAVDSESNLVLM